MAITQEQATKEGLRFEKDFRELLKEINNDGTEIDFMDKRHPLVQFEDYTLDEPAHLDFILPKLDVVMELKTMKEWEKKHYQLIPSYAEKHARGVFDLPNGVRPTFWYIIERQKHRSSVKRDLITRTDTQHRQYNEWFNPQDFHVILYEPTEIKGLINETKIARQG